MKQILIACILFCCMNSCSYGQDRSNLSGRSPVTNSIFNDPSIRNNPAVQKTAIALTILERYYVDSVNSIQLADDAIIHMLEKLDPHSYYMTAEEVKKANEPLQGNFEGIGVQFSIATDTLYIVDVIPGGPSEKVGILAGDKIIYVNDTLIAGVKIKNDGVLSKLKGPKGTSVNVKILRRGYPQLLDFKIIRDKIPIHSLRTSYMINNNVGYIKLVQFSVTTHNEFKEALEKLKSQGMENLILDLRGNGGGFLEMSTELANEFLKSGSLIVYTEGLNQDRMEWKANNSGSFKNGRLVILVDYASASASEIVSGAVQDWDRGVIVGTRTFGKGLVQRPFNLLDGSIIRLTTAYYYTPSGRSIQKPYTKGDLRSYHREVYDRNEELISADSIHFSDSLKYQTLTKNRTVYGGGGIMPDYYVPVDTNAAYFIAGTTLLLKEISYREIINKYVQNLIDVNREKYKSQYPLFESFNKNFTITDKMMNDILNIYKKEKAEELKEKGELKGETYQLSEEEQKDLEKSKWLISYLIKASIAREIYGEDEFYKLYNQLFDEYNKAVEIINNEEEYNKLLR